MRACPRLPWRSRHWRGCPASDTTAFTSGVEHEPASNATPPPWLKPTTTVLAAETLRPSCAVFTVLHGDVLHGALGVAAVSSPRSTYQDLPLALIERAVVEYEGRIRQALRERFGDRLHRLALLGVAVEEHDELFRRLARGGVQPLIAEAGDGLRRAAPGPKAAMAARTARRFIGRLPD